MFPHDGRDAETLLKNADTAMYRAKRRGRNNYQIFDPTMKVEVFQQLALDNGLRRALEAQRVRSALPAANRFAQRGHIRSAWKRWSDGSIRNWGLIPPSTFIQWAEDSEGLIIPIGDACCCAHGLQNKTKNGSRGGHYHSLKVGVNVSAKQMRLNQTSSKRFEQHVLKDTNLPPGMFGFGTDRKRDHGFEQPSNDGAARTESDGRRFFPSTISAPVIRR